MQACETTVLPDELILAFLTLPVFGAISDRMISIGKVNSTHQCQHPILSMNRLPS